MTVQHPVTVREAAVAGTRGAGTAPGSGDAGLAAARRTSAPVRRAAAPHLDVGLATLGGRG